LGKAGINAAPVMGMIVSIAALIAAFIAAKKMNETKVLSAISFLLLSIVWFILPNYWLMIALIVLAFLDLVSERELMVSFFADRIEFPSFPKKTICWKELSNVILKDRILTIDFKNDHLLQSETGEKSFDIDEETFNKFCQLQLKIATR
jgi:hypothetical protein